MAIRSYMENGKTLWSVYINVRSTKDSNIRLQGRKKGIENEQTARLEEKKLLKKLMSQLAERDGKGILWSSVVDQWEEFLIRCESERYVATTIKDYVAALHLWTKDWFNIPANAITKGDVRDVFDRMDQAGRTRNHQGNLRNIINMVFKWAIEERIVKDIYENPVTGVKIWRAKYEPVPDIFTLDQIRTLLKAAKSHEHPWYPVWAMALLTGMRNGELYALTWSDIDLVDRKITVSKSYNTRMKSVKSTKAGYWRTVPISDELYILLNELKPKTGASEHVLPHPSSWSKGGQAMVLKAFCIGIGLPSIKFHALRACFATQLLAHDVSPARVMKICGWKDLKTMQYYIRLAGVDEKGATNVLRIMDSDQDTVKMAETLFKTK